MPKRYNNIIYKLFFKSKKTIKATLNSITRIRPIIYIKDLREAFGINYIYTEEDIKVKKTTIANIITTSHPIKSNAISVINLDTN